MRNFILVCVVALMVACGVAYAVGFFEVTTDRSDGKFVTTLTVNTSMLDHRSSPASGQHSAEESALNAKGTITDVRPEKSEVVVTESFKNWTFHLDKDGKVFINGRESKLAELQTGDAADVTYVRQGQQLFASVIRSTRK